MTSTGPADGPPEPWVPASSAMALRAYLLTAAGSNIGGQIALSMGLPLTVAGFAAALMAVGRVRRVPERLAIPWIYAWLSAMLAVGIAVAPRDHPPLWYAILFRGVPVAGVFLVGVFAGAGAG